VFEGLKQEYQMTTKRLTGNTKKSAVKTRKNLSAAVRSEIKAYQPLQETIRKFAARIAATYKVRPGAVGDATIAELWRRERQRHAPPSLASVEVGRENEDSDAEHTKKVNRAVASVVTQAANDRHGRVHVREKRDKEIASAIGGASASVNPVVDDLLDQGKPTSICIHGKKSIWVWAGPGDPVYDAAYERKTDDAKAAKAFGAALRALSKPKVSQALREAALEALAEVVTANNDDPNGEEPKAA
jgi:hypothetical protein